MKRHHIHPLCGNGDRRGCKMNVGRAQKDL
uniref:Uncharacterized protein n=1 Tax=Anguilla anguilla TaxID=7936 RepID=A0A0E9P728_ANGAN